MMLSDDVGATCLETAEAGLEAVVEELAPRLLRFTLGLVRDRPLAEEAAQEALVALVRRWRRFGAPREPGAFAFAIARRKAARALWRRRWLAPFGAWPAGEEPAAEAVAVVRLEAVQALAELRHLPRRDREALLLVAVGELSMEEAAHVLRLSVSAFKMRLHRARKALRARVENGDGRNG